MLAILIFAGRSTRFWPLTEKNFFPIAGTTLLAEQVKRLREAGIKDILLVGGAHNLAEAKKIFPSLKIAKQQNLDLGMRGALLAALPHCKDGPVLVVSGNDVISASAYKELVKRGSSLESGGLLLARKVSKYFPGGYLSVKGGRITGIVEKPGKGKEPSSLVNIVAHVHASPSLLLKALKGVRPTKDDGYEMALRELFGAEIYKTVPYGGSWHPVKYPWHLLSLLSAFLPVSEKPSIHASAKIHKTAVIEGAVILSKNVRVLPHATIIGPCFVGEGTIIGNNALVRGSSVGKECVIGYNTEICRSVLGNNVWTHSSYVGDSVLGNNVSLGGGTVTGNLRFDEGGIASAVKGESVDTERTKFGAIIGENCRTGIHAGFAPGVKVGVNSFIAPHVFVSADVPEGSFVKSGAKGLEIRPNRDPSAKASTRDAFRNKLAP